MKVKRLKVGVRSIEEGMRELKNALKALKAGRTISSKPVSILSVLRPCNAFSPNYA